MPLGERTIQNSGPVRCTAGRKIVSIALIFKKIECLEKMTEKIVHNSIFRRGVAKLVKAPDFDSGMRGFESFLPCQV